jgi:DNA repair protein RadC
MLAAGPEDLSDYELLELILLDAQPSGDVEPVAKALIAKFGSFASVLAGDRAALTEAGLNLAAIAAVREAGLRLMHAKLQEQANRCLPKG